MNSLQQIWCSLKRNGVKIFILALIGHTLLRLVNDVPEALGDIYAPLFRGFGITSWGVAVGFFMQCLIDPHVSTQEIVKQAVHEKNTAASLVFLGRCILLMAVLFLMATASRADTLPANAVANIPILKEEINTHWPDLKFGSFLGAQIEQETCVSLKSKRCWSEDAQLLTSREQGVGLGQLTRAFRADGSIRFDAMAELKAKHPKALEGLSWSNWKNARLQLRAVVLKDKDTCLAIKNAATQKDNILMCMAAYNGGLGGLNNDRTSCRATPGCDHRKWYGNVENTSFKSKTIIPGYGRSPFQINREYVSTIDKVRRTRYLGLDA
jgi:hypothetical protein